MPDPLILRENDPGRLVALERPVARALSALDVFDLRASEEDGVWNLRAKTHVGAMSVGGLQIVIQPKIPIERVIFLMGYARRADHWRDATVHLDSASNLPEALAASFVRLATKALEQGLLKGYRTVDETLPVLRGRIREADQLRRHWGRGIPLEVRYDEFTVDIAENQLLRAAAEALLRSPQVRDKNRAGLQRARMMLSDVSVPVPGGMRPTWTPSRLNARYAPALELADLILDGHSFEQRIGGVAVSGYLVNMASIFEDFVSVALAESLVGVPGGPRSQFHTHLDMDRRVPVRPDFVWLQGDRPVIVADAKYKAEKPSGFPQADLYQMLAYCTVFGLSVGHLVYAKGNENAVTHVVRETGVRIIAHAIDLEVPPENVVAQMRLVANQMARHRGR